VNRFGNGGYVSDRNFAHYASLGICGLRVIDSWLIDCVMVCSGAVCVDDGRVMQGDPWWMDCDGL